MMDPPDPSSGIRGSTPEIKRDIGSATVNGLGKMFNTHVASGLTDLYGKSELSDCTVVFTVPFTIQAKPASRKGKTAPERQNGAIAGHEQGADAAQPTSAKDDVGLACKKRKASAAMAPEAEPGAPEDPNSGAPGNTHAQAGSRDRPPGDDLRVLVEPLPAHKVVLWLASERFQTQVSPHRRCVTGASSRALSWAAHRGHSDLASWGGGSGSGRATRPGQAAACTHRCAWYDWRQSASKLKWVRTAAARVRICRVLSAVELAGQNMRKPYCLNCTAT